MTNTKLNVLFKKIQKDDKKEVLEFHVQGDELPHSDELVGMAGSITIINVENCEAGEITAEFTSLQRDSKKTSLKFNVKGDSEGKIIKLYPHAGKGVTLSLHPSQMSIDEFYEGDDHEGIQYQIDNDGTATVVPDQLSLDDVKEEIEDHPEPSLEEDPFDSNEADEDTLE
jgi:hypothetical protein